MELQLFEEEADDERIPNYRFVVHGEKTVQVRRGGPVGGESIASLFYENPPIFWFADGSSLEGNQYVELKSAYPPDDRAKIDAWDWTGIDLRKESQRDAKHPSSIQARVIQELKKRDYAMIIDDDGKGEAADIVAIRLTGDQLDPLASTWNSITASFPRTPHRGADKGSLRSMRPSTKEYGLDLKSREVNRHLHTPPSPGGRSGGGRPFDSS